ncbi:MAG: TIGR02281 family clan AA aspartic protease [Rhizobiales bacterium]|nr:TIGR02281 family clan AA aspartic protease [Hyphomicrobiales bacterium]
MRATIALPGFSDVSLSHSRCRGFLRAVGLCARRRGGSCAPWQGSLHRFPARTRAGSGRKRPKNNNGAGGFVRIRSDRSGHHVTDVDFNGRRLRAIVDTGATLVALRYEDARALGLVTPSDRFDIQVSTANGSARAKRVQLRSVRIGSIQIENVEAMVLDQGALGQNLLGMSFLRRLARFEFKKGVLELER